MPVTVELMIVRTLPALELMRGGLPYKLAIFKPTIVSCAPVPTVMPTVTAHPPGQPPVSTYLLNGGTFHKLDAPGVVNAWLNVTVTTPVRLSKACVHKLAQSAGSDGSGLFALFTGGGGMSGAAGASSSGGGAGGGGGDEARSAAFEKTEVNSAAVHLAMPAKLLEVIPTDTSAA